MVSAHLFSHPLAQVRPDFHPTCPFTRLNSYSYGGLLLDNLGDTPSAGSFGHCLPLISRRSLIDSISRFFGILFEMPYTTMFPPGLPPDLEHILRDLHASTERLMDEVAVTNRLLHRLAMYPPHALPTQPWLPGDVMLPPLPHPYGAGPTFSRTESPP